MILQQMTELFRQFLILVLADLAKRIAAMRAVVSMFRLFAERYLISVLPLHFGRPFWPSRPAFDGRHFLFATDHTFLQGLLCHQIKYLLFLRYPKPNTSHILDRADTRFDHPSILVLIWGCRLNLRTWFEEGQRFYPRHRSHYNFHLIRLESWIR